MVVVAEVRRSGFVEGHHHGSVVALAADGSRAFSVGYVDVPVFPRSSNKPMQAAGMLRAGLDLDGELLALAAASHSGEPMHLDGVRRILAGVGLKESALGTPPDYPVDEVERLSYVRAGHAPAPLAMNCSGKHAAMLATCVVNGWPVAGYLSPEHPVQVAIRDTVEDMAGEKVTAVGVDGCGAPLFALSLGGLARAFRACVLGEVGSAERRVADAMRAHPAYAGGSRRDVTRLMEGVAGLLAKDGAEGVYAAALPDGRAVALKIGDGASRARPPVMVAALRALGVAEAPVLAELAQTPVLGGGRRVGEVRAVAGLFG